MKREEGNGGLRDNKESNKFIIQRRMFWEQPFRKKKKQWMGELKVKRGVGAGKRTEDRRRENTSMLCTC